MDIILHIPDELARLIGTTGDIERRALEALTLAEYQAGRLTRPELRRLLGFESRFELDGFLEAHGINEGMAPAEFAREQQDLDRPFPDEVRREKARQAAANIIARRKGVTLGGLKIKDLINEGRP
jgi:hypothetical protein